MSITKNFRSVPNRTPSKMLSKSDFRVFLNINLILISDLDYVDRVDMEVISFTIRGSSSAVKKPAFGNGFVHMRLARPAAERNTSYHFHSESGRARSRSVKKSRIAAILAFAIPLYIVTSVLCSKIVKLYDNRVLKVDFTLSALEEAETNYVDQAMFDFAVSSEPYYDSNGDIVSADDSEEGESAVSPVTADGVYKDSISYSTYTVKSGDSISSISLKFGLSNISTLIAVNGISNVRYLRSGQKLRIPSMDGMIHTVSDGETVEGLSVKYHAAVEDILDVNDLDSYTLTAGQELFIPGAKLDSTALQRAMGEVFAWPIKAKFRISSMFGSRKDPFTGADSYHTGVDLACPTGTPVKAAMSGTVVRAGWSNVFGNYIIVKHLDGYQTLYGHLSKIEVSKNAFVNQGDEIGLVGSTGYSTGPHLHFTVYKNGKLVNPMNLLK